MRRAKKNKISEWGKAAAIYFRRCKVLESREKRDGGPANAAKPRTGGSTSKQGRGAV